MKFCNDCKTDKPECDFYKNVRKPDGLDIYCKPCVNARSRDNYQKNKNKRRQQNREWLSKNPGKAATYCKKWRQANPDKASASDARWYVENREKKLGTDKRRRETNIVEFLERERASYAKHRDARAARGEAWRKKNKPVVAAHAAKRRTAKAQRTPPWLTPKQHEEILAFYVSADALGMLTGEWYHVDHIVPLRGKTVSGLHVPWNLQVLPATVNLQKRNRYES